MEARPLRLPLALGAVCTALLAACGSSNSTATGGTATSSTSSSSVASGASSSGGVQASATTPCSSAHFGAALQPRDAPGNVHAYQSTPAKQIDDSKLYLATIRTARGDIALCLQPQLAPNTVNNFVVLARNHFYDGLTFHRVVPGFVVQGGDPKGDGTGGPGYEFADETVRGSYTAGCVAMANAGPNTNGSQFFICIDDCRRKLAPSYNLFGYVTEGMDVALGTQVGDVMRKVAVEERPRS
jgi:cyclophilin family peptidyl-prolyl cis-trans isomerase